MSVQELLQNLSQRLQVLENENQQLKNTVHQQQNTIEKQQRQIDQLLLSSSKSTPTVPQSANSAIGIQAHLQKMNQRLTFAEAGAKVLREEAALKRNNVEVVRQFLILDDVEGAVRFHNDSKLFFDTDIVELGIKEKLYATSVYESLSDQMFGMVQQKKKLGDEFGAAKLEGIFAKEFGVVFKKPARNSNMGGGNGKSASKVRFSVSGDNDNDLL